MQIPQPMQRVSEMAAILSVGDTSMQSFPILTTGHDFLHSCLHLFGLHLSALTIAILVNLSVSSNAFFLDAMSSAATCKTINQVKNYANQTLLSQEVMLCNSWSSTLTCQRFIIAILLQNEIMPDSKPRKQFLVPHLKWNKPFVMKRQYHQLRKL